MSETVYIGLGSNLGDRKKFLDRAIELMDNLKGLEITAQSGVYLTEPQDMAVGVPSFYNQVVRGEYEFGANQLLAELEGIEKSLGRTDKGNYEPRSIDLDLLLFGEQQIESATLVVPHPHLTQRPFMLVPLLDIEPGLTHPASNKPFSEFLSRNQEQTIVLVEDHVAREF